MPDPRTAATRIQRLAVTVTTLEVLAAHEMLDYRGPGQLVERDPMPALRDERCCRPRRELDLVPLFQAAPLEPCHRLTQVREAADRDGALAIWGILHDRVRSA